MMPRSRASLLVTVLALAIAVLPAGSIARAEPRTEPRPALRIGVVLSIGGLQDHAYNDATYAGVQNLRQRPGCLVDVIEPGDAAAIEPALEHFARQGHDLIVGVGIFANEPIRRVAERHPDRAFALFDSVVTLPNVLSILFNEEEGSFYAGAVAGLLTRSQTVGFLGGMVSPIIKCFESGFQKGVTFVNPKARVLVRYAGDTPAAFHSPEIGSRLGRELAEAGADLIFHAAGRTGLGLIQAARQGRFLVIGVDGDQTTLAPGKIVASLVKRLDVALDRAFRTVAEGRFKGGVLTLGLADAGIELVLSRFNKDRFTSLVQDRLREVEAFLLHK
ncbi:MAG: basic membrane lipoprotein [Candidatus Ozemobacter sibiricus]|jgi:basic membrane protein A|uniref:Basic membrane lipoprotein n=1 Tax=Candidatus Ozemobacter sibiricus TaxID=2268124 RepID=A0A367ZRZ5_9BACT|nr:MAG: basic membrane lipoprotein [Candidatus Ozemobacter sibiricus]